MASTCALTAVSLRCVKVFARWVIAKIVPKELRVGASSRFLFEFFRYSIQMLRGIGQVTCGCCRPVFRAPGMQHLCISGNFLKNCQVKVFSHMNRIPFCSRAICADKITTPDWLATQTQSMQSDTHTHPRREKKSFIFRWAYHIDNRFDGWTQRGSIVFKYSWHAACGNASLNFFIPRNRNKSIRAVLFQHQSCGQYPHSHAHTHINLSAFAHSLRWFLT